MNGAAALHLGAPGVGVRSISIDGRGGDDLIRIKHAIGSIDPANPAQCLVCLNVTGGAGINDTLIGPDDGAGWTIDHVDGGSADGITSFTGIENLVGGSLTDFGPARDVFSIVDSGAISGTIDGAGGLDEIIGPDAANTWLLTGANVGSVTGTDYLNIENITGGSHDDVFKVLPGGTVTGLLHGGGEAEVPGQPSVTFDDTLDYTAYGSPVLVHLGLLDGARDHALRRRRHRQGGERQR